jgi:hypothetical protein
MTGEKRYTFWGSIYIYIYLNQKEKRKKEKEKKNISQDKKRKVSEIMSFAFNNK